MFYKLGSFVVNGLSEYRLKTFVIDFYLYQQLLFWKKKKIIRDNLPNIIKLSHFWLYTYFSDSEILCQFKWAMTNSLSFIIMSTDSELNTCFQPIFSHAKIILQKWFYAKVFTIFMTTTHIHKNTCVDCTITYVSQKCIG